MANSIKSVFLDALELPASERATYIEKACGGNPDKIAGVRAFLDVHEDADSLLEELAFAVDPQVSGPEAEAASLIGRQIGPHRLTEELGRGGMGIVYRAERVDGQFEHEVALKILRHGLIPEHGQRFQTERRILAGLQHPAIAHLIDGGAMEDGTPYLVMEYVHGKPINEYCDEHGLSIEARIELFQKVCRSVQFAHQHLIVHRDLKPSNILVVHDDENRPQVKLLDFGVAKLLADHDEGDSAATDGMRLLTPRYASPEQLRGESVTTASDVYQLGVLLYELLTGQLPHRRPTSTLHALPPTAAEDEPPRPSTRVTQPEVDEEADRQDVGRARGLTADRLSRRLRGDLDVICLKALRADVARRYESVADLAEDLRRHLDGLPVRARPESGSYRLRKFVGRHRWGVAAACSFLFLLVAFAVSMTLQQAETARQRDLVTGALEDAERKRDEAGEVTDFLVTLFDSNDPWRMEAQPTEISDLLDRGIARIADLEGQPGLQSDLQHTMGRVCANLGRYEEAEGLFRASLKTRRALDPEPRPELEESLMSLATVLYARHERKSAVTIFRELQPIQEELHGHQSRPIAKTLYRLGALLHSQGEFAEGERLFHESVAIYQDLPGEGDLDEARSLELLGQLLAIRRQWDEAVPLFERSLEIIERLYPDDHLEVARCLGMMAASLEPMDTKRSEPLFRRALEIERKRELPPDHFMLLRHTVALGRILTRTDRAAEGEPLLRTAREAHLESHGLSDDRTLGAQLYLGECLVKLGKFDEAEPLLEEARDAWRALRGPRHPLIGHVLRLLGLACQATGRPAEAGQHFRESLELWKSWRDDHPEVAVLERHLRELGEE